MNARVLWVIVAGFLLGVFVRSLVPLGWPFAVFLFLLGFAALLLARIAVIGNQKSVIIFIALAACGAGVLRMDAAALAGDPALTARLGEKVILEGVVFEEPDVREKSERLSLRADTAIFQSATASAAAGVLVIAPLHSGASYGDRVRVEGTLRLPQEFETGDGRSFDYPSYLAVRGILYELVFAQVENVEERRGNALKAFAIGVKQKFLEGVAISMQEPQAGLAGGITVGDKRGLGEELSLVFRTVSLTHIIVLSGYNVMIVVDTLARMLARAPRALRFGGGGIVAVLFALMTGLASASVRAAAMAVIAIAGRASGRMYLAGRALGVVALGMVFWNPFVLLYDPGFQLSVIATWGLIALAPLLAPKLSFIPHTLGLREIATSTISAQIAVLPLLLYQTGNLSIVGLPANLLTLLAVPWAMLFTAIAAIAGLFFGAFSVFIALPAYLLLLYITSVSKFFAALPFASVSITAFSAWWLFAAYAILFGGVWYIKNNRPRREVGAVRNT